MAPERQARLLDITFGICFQHKYPMPMIGMIRTGSLKSYTDNKNTARYSDKVVGLCGHSSDIYYPCAEKSYTDNLKNARRYDWFFGPYFGVILTGSKRKIVN